MMKKKYDFLSGVFLFLFFLFVTQDVFTQEKSFNCFSVLAGGKATVNGAVLFAHNEDDGGEQVVYLHKVPGLQHKKREKINLQNGGVVTQIAHTIGYLWLEMPGMKFSDSFLNESGVCIASDACASREEKPVLTDGGIGWNLRRLMAGRAHSAREAVKIGGELISRYGYASSGRTYCIAGPNEAWMLSVVNGKHWVAQRIPDDEVAIIPNYYTITRVDLKDTMNFYGSSDLITYAVKRGWYDPKIDRAFNFRKAYGRKSSQDARGNITRKCMALNILSEKQYKLNESFPFSFKPDRKVSVTKLMGILRNHYEGTPLDLTDAYKNGSPHMTKERTICTATTRYGFVTELRSWMPPAIGVVMWLAPRRPCTQAFTPWYAGIDTVPEDYGRLDYSTALKNHFRPEKRLYSRAMAPAYYSFSAFSEYADSNYAQVISKVRPANMKFEKEIMRNQASFEKMILPVYQDNPLKARKLLTEFSGQLAQENLHRNQQRGKKFRKH